VEVLCAAYDEIKQHDPEAIVISAGLAPVGRVTGEWEGRVGHNGLYQDEREFLKEMITAVDAHASDCLDAVGYHNYGFSADFDTPPDTPFDQNPSPEDNCKNGFCFRGIEPIYDIMSENGWGDKEVWSTELGWIIDPAEVGLPECANDPSMSGRAWQFVTPDKQAENLAGAFAYAAENYPWMGGIILFNLNFNKASYYRDCEQMRFYSVEDRPAEEALRELPKAYEALLPQLEHGQIGSWTGLGEINQPIKQTLVLTLSNRGDAPLTFTVAVDEAAVLLPTLSGTATSSFSSQLSPSSSERVTATVLYTPTAQGELDGRVTVSVDPAQDGYPTTLPIKLTVSEQIYRLFAALIER
ncbi:MAG: hypothetical protein AAF633_17655, partial [Chloroflexota bacterium]